MKRVAIIISFILLSGVILFSYGQKKYFVKGKSVKESIKAKQQVSEKNCAKKYDFLRNCDGQTYNSYPLLDRVNNNEFLEVLRKIQRIEITQTYTKVLYNPLSNDLINYLFNESIKIDFKNYGYSDFNKRIDSENLTWAPVAQLPTNGKFIMMIFANWEKDAYEPPSNGFFLSTFNLTGEMLSAVYVYGHEEFVRNKYNMDTLSSIWGKSYCLNTNLFVVRKALVWNDHFKQGNFFATIEIKEIRYSISEEGKIQFENEKIVFPKKQVNWKDREGISFSEKSDTIRKMLGEIE